MNRHEPAGKIDTTLTLLRASNLLRQLADQFVEQEHAAFMTGYLLAQYERMDAGEMNSPINTIKEDAFEKLAAYLRGEQMHPLLPRRPMERDDERG